MKIIMNTINKYQFSLLKNQNVIPRRFQNQQPKRQKLFTLQDRQIQYNPWQAIKLMKVHSFTTFQETVQVCLQLGVNPKDGEQIVRGTAILPSGLGKEISIAVLCQPQQRQELQQAGAKIFIDEQQIKNIQKGVFNFDKLFCTPDLLNKIKNFGKILGPKGLMPNPKLGTLVDKKKLAQAIKLAKAGQVTFRVDTGSNLHAPIGKISFTDQQLLLNLKSLIKTLIDKRPQKIKKKYFQAAYLKSTMGPRWKLKLQLINPKQASNIWQLVQ